MIIGLLLFPAYLACLDIKGYKCVDVLLLNDQQQQPMALYYSEYRPWPEFQEEFVTLPTCQFAYLPETLQTRYDLISLEIIKDK